MKSDCWQLIGAHNEVSYPKHLAPGTRVNFPVKWLKQQPQPARITYIRGTVSVTDETGTYPAELAQQLGIGTVINIGEQSALSLQFADGSSMRVNEPTRLRLDRLSAFGPTGMVDTRVFLERGALRITVPKKDPPTQFRVITPSAVAAVRGTDFRVTHNDSHVLTNGVYDGKVAVTNPLGEQNIPRGFGTVAEKNAPPIEAVKLLPAPKFKNRKKSSTATIPYLLDWADVRQSKSYRVELFKPDAQNAVLFAATVSKSELVLEGLIPQCYTVRISAIDQYDLFGMPATKKLCLSHPAPPKKESPWGILTVLAIALGLSL